MATPFDNKLDNLSVEMVTARRLYSKRQLQGLRTRAKRLASNDTTAGGTPRLTLLLRELDTLINTKD